MRRTLLLVGMAILIAQPAQAQTDTYNYRSSRDQDSSGSSKSLEKKKDAVFGVTRCRPNFACASIKNQDSSSAVISSLVGISNNCVKKYFGMVSQTGYFDDSIGLDSSDCLTTKKLATDPTGITMTPKCCVKQESDGQTCYVNCINSAVK